MILSTGIGRILAFSVSLVAAVKADTLVEKTSFGNGKRYVCSAVHDEAVSNGFYRISPDMTTLPGWQLFGEDFIPEIVSQTLVK